MDWSWLGSLFGGIIGIFRKVYDWLRHNVWTHLLALYKHLHDWYKWYQDHVQKPMQRARQNFRRIYDQFMRPILKIVDLVRRITGLVGLFNKRLAAKLNRIFLRIESDLLLPLRLFEARVNTLSHMFGGFLTPLGYFDHNTFLNSAWRDVADLRAILRNPLGEHLPAGVLPGTPEFADQVRAVTDSIDTDSGAVSDRARAAFDTFRSLVSA